MAKKKEISFPRNLYKKGGPEAVMSARVEYKYSTVLVTDENDMKVALKEGYVDDFSSIMSDDVEVEEKTSIDFEEDDDF